MIMCYARAYIFLHTIDKNYINIYMGYFTIAVHFILLL